MSDKVYKVCDICKDKTNCNFDLAIFGDWQRSRDIQVHYFCLLLSTNLPQRGQDCSGINGFLLRDIRKEITAAAKRECCYCGRTQATIQCHNCHEYFHFRCGHLERALFTFTDDFRSYCNECIPKAELKPAGLKARPSSFERCSICRQQMGLYNEVIFIFGKCCNKGFAHSLCVQKFALAAGYYLRCLWCGSADFRNTVRRHGIFVPDRDAYWEKQKDTYKDLYRGHNKCDMNECFCPKGRDYSQGRWSIILCSLCGSVGAHNPKCLLGKENAREPVSIFKCATCARTEASITNRVGEEARDLNYKHGDIIDRTIFVTKTNSNSYKDKETTVNSIPTFSEEDDEMCSMDSAITVVPRLHSAEVGQTATHKEGEQSVVNAVKNDGSTLKENGAGKIVLIDITEDDAIEILAETPTDAMSAESLTQQHTSPLPIKEEEEINTIFFSPSHRSARYKTLQENRDDQLTRALGSQEDETQRGAISEPKELETNELQRETIEYITTDASSTITATIQCVDIIQEGALLASNQPIIVPLPSAQVAQAERHIGGQQSIADASENDANEEHLQSQMQNDLNLQDEETQIFPLNSSPRRKETNGQPPTTTAITTEASSTTAATTTTTQCANLSQQSAASASRQTMPLNDGNQSPEVTSSSEIGEQAFERLSERERCETLEDWLSFDIYEYDEEIGKAFGSATVRINLCEERFAGMTLDEIQLRSAELLTETDIVSRSNTIGIFAEIDKIIAEYI